MTSSRDSNSILTAGLVGTGAIATFHVQAIKALKNVRVTGVFDTDHARADEFAALHQVPQVFRTLEALLSSGPTAVHVLTPPESHADIAVAALRAGSHVFVEKPLATTVEDCDRLGHEAKSAGRQLCVGYSQLRDPFVRRALRVVEAGEIGDVVGADHLRGMWYAPYAGGPWPYQFDRGGFPFRDLGVHSLYLLETFLGPIKDAHLTLGKPSRDGCPMFKEWRVTVECERGLGTIYLTGTSQPVQDVLTIHGTRGVLRIDITGMSITTRRVMPLPGPAVRLLNATKEGAGVLHQVPGNALKVGLGRIRRYHGLRELVAEFYAALARGGESPVSVGAARSVTLWTEKIAQEADQAKQRHHSLYRGKRQAKTLVTGATGFIGRPLLARLMASRPKVRVLVRQVPADPLFHDDKVEVVLGNLGNAQDVAEAAADVDEIFHLGAAVSGWMEDFACATIAGTRNILDVACSAPGCRLIYMSSLSVLHLSKAGKKDIVTEAWPLEPHPDRRGAYSETKLQAERMVLAAVRERGLRAVLLRPGEVVSDDRPFLSGAAAIDTSRLLLRLGPGGYTVPLIWMEDLIDAIVAAADRGPFDGTVINLVDPTPVTQRGIIAAYRARTTHKKPVAEMPLPVLYTLAFGADQAFRLLLRRSAPITPYRLRSALGHRRFDCTLAERTLGWKPRVGILRGMGLSQ